MDDYPYDQKKEQFDNEVLEKPIKVKANSHKLFTVTLLNSILLFLTFFIYVGAVNIFSGEVLEVFHWCLLFIFIIFVSLNSLSFYYAIKEIINLCRSEIENKLLSTLSIILMLIFGLASLFLEYSF